MKVVMTSLLLFVMKFSFRFGFTSNLVSNNARCCCWVVLEKSLNEKVICSVLSEVFYLNRCWKIRVSEHTRARGFTNHTAPIMSPASTVLLLLLLFYFCKLFLVFVSNFVADFNF